MRKVSASEPQLRFDNERHRHAQFGGKEYVQIISVASRFEACSFDNVRVMSAALGAGLGVSEYVDCTFDRSRICFAVGGTYRLERCSFRDVELQHWFCFATEIVDCTFTGSLHTAVFNGRP